MARETITFKGERDFWQKFTLEAKKKKQEIWNILKPYLKDYLSKRKNDFVKRINFKDLEVTYLETKRRKEELKRKGCKEFVCPILNEDLCEYESLHVIL